MGTENVAATWGNKITAFYKAKPTCTWEIHLSTPTYLFKTNKSCVHVEMRCGCQIASLFVFGLN